jgi:para-aminobenzoate synthetase component I
MPALAIEPCRATLVERLEPALDPLGVFRSLAHLPHVMFLDSAARDPHLGRYSFVTADPIAWWEAATTNDGAEAFAAVTQIVNDLQGLSLPNLPPFQGGVAGMFGYELGGSFEKVPTARFADFQLPTLALGWYDVVVAFDHLDQSAWLVSQGWPETDPLARRERAVQRLDEFRRYLSTESSHNLGERERLPPICIERLVPQFAMPGYHSLTSNFAADGYCRAVARAIEYIYAGDVYQVNLSQRLLHPAVGHSVDLYCRLRERNPAPFAGYMDLGNWQLLSASPERFLRIEDRHVETRPIKGTAARSRNLDSDSRSGRALVASAKDRAENVMIVDLLRNDLSRACRPESVRVSQLCGLETYAWVQHLVSVVEGRLREDQSPLDLLRSCFPGGSITGAPKLRAMEIIAELEPTTRGAYCGSLGYLSVNGQMDLNILIRTITAGRGWWQLPVGGGIVAQSEPQREYDETWSKAKGLIEALTP